MKLVAHKNSGTGAIKSPVILIAESVTQTAEQIFATVPTELEPLIVEQSSLPNVNYIAAWYIQNGKINIDMNIARDYFRGGLRQWRQKFLNDLDVTFQRALETNADTSAIVAQKQYYRDIPEDQRIDQANSLEELDQLWLTITTG